MNELTNEFCEQILRLDPSIRYAGILDRSENIIMEAVRDTPLLPKNVAEFSLKQAAKRMRERTLLRPYIGRPIYFIGVYEKVIRLTIPLIGKYYLLAISMDTNTEYQKIIKNILLFLEKHKLIEDKF